MISKCFAVYDSKAEAYLTPFFMPSTGAAVRAFTDLVNDRNTTVSRHPEDYNLFQIGEYDDASGSVSSVTKISLGCAIEFKKDIVSNLSEAPAASISELRQAFDPNSHC